MRKIATVSLLLAALTALACGLGGTESSNGSGGSGGGAGVTGANEGAAAKIGDPVRDGKFEFTVQEVECGVKEVGPELLEEKAQGQFCLVTITVKNIGTEPQAFSDSTRRASPSTVSSTRPTAGRACSSTMAATRSSPRSIPVTRSPV